MTRKKAKAHRQNGRGKGKPLTRAERNIAWIEKHCRVPEGKFVGQPVRLRDFQKKILYGIYDSPTRTAIISFAKKNAKTALSAMLLLLHLGGPEARANSQLHSAAQSREQAAMVFGYASKMVRMSPDLAAFIVVRDTRKELYCLELGTLYRALSAEVKTSHGLSPVFVVHDELGQVHGPRSPLYSSLEFGMSAHDHPLSIVISTQAPTDADLLSVLIDDAETNRDPRVKLFLWTSDPEADPFDIETIKAANPAFGDFQDAEEILSHAEKAKRLPSEESEYRNLILNQRVQATNPFVTPTIWKDNSGEVSEDWSGAEVFGGLDLSAVDDLTALVLVAQIDDLWQIRPTFWLPEGTLLDHAKKDRVPYDVWQKSGLLKTTPGKAIEYEYVASEVVRQIKELGIKKIGFDRWNMKFFRPWLKKAGMSEEEITEVFEEFGQGFQSMSPAVKTLETLLLNGKTRHGGHPILTMCAVNSVVRTDEAEGKKLDKMKSHGRIDGMVALAMAVGVANAGAPEEDKEIVYASGQMYGR